MLRFNNKVLTKCEEGCCRFVRACLKSYLLLILPLQMKPGLDVPSGLLKGLSLGNLSRVVGADADDVGAQEDQDVGTHLDGAENGE